MIARPDVDAVLRRLLVDLDRPAALDEWRLDRRRETWVAIDPGTGSDYTATVIVRPTAHQGAVRVLDKYGRDVQRVA